MDNAKLREIWRVWHRAHDTTKNLEERLVAGDILEIIRELITEKVTNACLKDPTLDADDALREVLGELGIPKRQYET